MDTLLNLIDSLHQFERKVLVHLEKKRKVEELAELSGLSLVQVMRGAQWLSNKELAVIEEDKVSKVVLTERGREVVEKGLPELRLLSYLSKVKKATFSELKSGAELDNKEFNKALGICRKNGYISMLNGVVSLTSLGSKFLKEERKREELISKIGDKGIELKKIDKKIVDELVERGIVAVETKTTYTIAATPLGLKIIKRGIDVESDLLEKNSVEVIRSGVWKTRKFRRYNVKEPVPKKYFGKLHPYQEFIESIKDRFVALGFKEMTGPYVENNFCNCDALFMPQDHPARGIHDIFYIKEPKFADLKEYKKYIKKVKKAHEKGIAGSKGWRVPFDEEVTRRYVLRSQTTSASARMLMNKNLEIPGKYFVIDRNVRPDVIDRTHGAEFFQMEGIVLGEDLNLRKLFDLLRMFAEEIAQVKKYKLMPDYYPYTEPSVSLHIWSNNRWMELGGAGIFRKEVTAPLGVNVPVIAWGLGFDRAFMSERGIDDIRQLFTQDLSWLREVEVK